MLIDLIILFFVLQWCPTEQRSSRKFPLLPSLSFDSPRHQKREGDINGSPSGGKLPKISDITSTTSPLLPCPPTYADSYFCADCRLSRQGILMVKKLFFTSFMIQEDIEADKKLYKITLDRTIAGETSKLS